MFIDCPIAEEHMPTSFHGVRWHMIDCDALNVELWKETNKRSEMQYNMYKHKHKRTNTYTSQFPSFIILHLSSSITIQSRFNHDSISKAKTKLFLKFSSTNCIGKWRWRWRWRWDDSYVRSMYWIFKDCPCYWWNKPRNVAWSMYEP